MALLGRVEFVPLREVWNDEARHFTPWLASEEGLSLLGDILGLDLEFSEIESRVGSFKSDILIRLSEEEEDKRIIVENQFGKTDHDHLGKIITYGAGHNAETIVWVAEEFTDEHRQALDWMNEHTPDVHFFGLQIQLLRIGDSTPAPQFKIVSSPNEWTKALRATRAKGVSETKLDQLAFWEELQEYAASSPRTGIQLGRKPRPQHWYNISIGRSGFNIALSLNSVQDRVGCEVFMRGDTAKSAFDQLIEQKQVIEEELDVELEWQRLDEKIGSRVAIYKDGRFEVPEERTVLINWLYEWAVKFHEVFGSRIKELKL